MITKYTKLIRPAPDTSRRIGRYQLLDCLATGGMAQVFLALSGELSAFRTLVVVKRILPHLSSNKHFIQMFFDEARLAALLDHPNIVRIIEVGQDAHEYFLAMEAVQGRSLSSLLRRGFKRQRPLTEAQAAHVVAQAAHGLGYAHNLTDARGRRLEVVHRDVSPQNILISFEGAVKVIDFGVARALGRVTETRAGGLKGKLHYMSPEQVSGGQVDQRSDVFALGVVLWEALCERRLFRRETELDTMRAIVDEPILRPSKVTPVSARLERIVMRALEKDPADRFQTADEMALALSRHAFATEGFDPVQVGALMKELFAREHERWRKTVAAARQLEGAPEDWADTEGTFVRPRSVELRTSATVALHPPSPPPRGLRAVGAETQSEVRAQSDVRTQSTGWSLASAPHGQRRRRLGLAGLSLATLAVAAALLLARAPSLLLSPPVAVTPYLPPVTIQPLGPPPRPAPAAVPAGGPVVAAQAAPPVALASKPAALLVPVVALPPAPLGRQFGPPSPPARAAKHAAARTVVLPKRSPAGEASCRVTLGTRPWSEVWIDGRKMPRHTPFTDTVRCGTHTLTFKRPDLELSRSFKVTLYPGEPSKQSFSLTE